jgi:5-methyltetrahydrofolate--homocysteine methyltransferase
MQPFLDFVNDKSIVLGDGAMGSMLLDAGMALGDCAELWNTEKADVILSIHKQYIEAGCDFILTNTFGANPFRLAEHALQDRTAELNKAAVTTAKKAAGESCYVIGSIGPTGRVPEPVGNADRATLSKGFRMQVEALLDSGVDALITETMMHVEEALCALETIRCINSDIPVISSICFQHKDGDFQTALGHSPADASKILTEAGSNIIGANCMISFESYAELVKQLKEGTTLPIMVQPNAGQPITENGSIRYPMTPGKMMEYIPAITAAGAKITGGCCGTTPAHTAAIRQWINTLS